MFILQGKKLSPEKEVGEEDLGDVSEDDEAAEMVIQGASDDVDGLKEMLSRRQEKQKEKEKVRIINMGCFHSETNSTEEGNPLNHGLFV